MTDYLTCGDCMREFPLQKIVLFIQHKKLNCDDEPDISAEDAELQCIYCPAGFMTAWGLLVHAQLTHNLKIFLEKTSGNILQLTKPKLSELNQSIQSVPVRHSSDKDQVLPLSHLNTVLNASLKDTEIAKEGHRNVDKECVTGVRSVKTDIGEDNVNDTPWTADKMGSNILVVSNTGNGKRVISERPKDQETVQNYAQSVDVNPNPLITNPLKSSTPKTCPLMSTNITPTVNNEHLSLSRISDGQLVVLKNLPESGPIVKAPRLPPTPKMSSAILKVNEKAAVYHNMPPTVLHTHGTEVIKSSKSGHSAVTAVSTSISSSNKEQSIERLQIGESTKLTLPVSIASTSSKSLIPVVSSGVDITLDINEERNISSDLERIETEERSITEEIIIDENSTDSVDRCCKDEDCGVTVIPVSHEHLKECCNAVVPKKRKRHMEQKHMPFAWGTSRYASRKLLYRSRAARALSSQMFSKQTESTIYIDVEPESLMIDENSDQASSNRSQSASLRVTQTLAGEQSSNSPSSSLELSSETSKKHSLILKPGAVFSIPFSYTIPSSASIPVSTESTTTSDTTTTSHLELTEVQSAEAAMFSGNGEPVAKMAAMSKQSQSGTKEMIRTSILARKSTKTPATSDEDEKPKSYSSKPFQCEKCNMTFNQRIHLKKHMSKHTGIKPYKCEKCNYSTVERSHLKVHIRIHTGEKPFKCTYCEYATAQNSTLKIHLKRHHGGKMFQCKSCDKQFTQEQQLKGHISEHSGLPISATDDSVVMSLSTSGALSTTSSNQIALSSFKQEPTTNENSSNTQPKT